MGGHLNKETNGHQSWTMKRYFMAIVVASLGCLLLNIGEATPTKSPSNFKKNIKVAEVVKPVVAPTPLPTPVPTPVPTPTPKPVPSGSCELVNRYNWPRAVARAVCLGESSGNQNSTNMGDNHRSCVGSFGLMQIGCFWAPYYGYAVSDLYNPEINMEIAYKIWARNGSFGAWSAYTTGKYLKYL